MPEKQLKDYLELMRAASSDYNDALALSYGKAALKKFPESSYSPHEKFSLYGLLGHAYTTTAECSRGLDFYYKALLAASVPSLNRSYRAYILAKMGEALMLLRNVNQALKHMEEIEQYVQACGYSTPPMSLNAYRASLIVRGYCLLYRHETEKAREIIEKKIPAYQDILHSDVFDVDFNHLKGEYFTAAGDYNSARRAFEESVRISGIISFSVGRCEAQMHLASLDVMEGRINSAVLTLKSIMKEMKLAGNNPIFAEAGLLLSKCFHLCEMPDKAALVERKIRRALDTVDTVWLFEKNREFENLCRTLQSAFVKTAANAPDVPAVLTRTLRNRYELPPYKNIIGRSVVINEIYNIIEKIAPTDMPVLIQGETGTGKELAANALHQNSLRKNKNWLAFNCGALSDTLMENELFGHVRGAFTGAGDIKRGYIELASGSTLFVDEIADMPFAMQQKFLRVFEERQVWRIGAEKPVPVNTRFIFASNQNIEQLTDKKMFRQDLFYRIGAIIINMPALRERKEDIPLLMNWFLEKYSANSAPMDISQEALDAAVNYPWPGNIRELKNEIKRICTIYKNSGHIELPMLAPDIRAGKEAVRGPENQMTYRELRDVSDKKIFSEALRKCKGNIAMAARMLNYNRSALHRKIKLLDITL
ncbi:MAG: sigma-54-dependent Fis family transcriptional regulator [Planctomycetes bacterium]|nr:sigma-54-dependent Fis family transcriptional regulator [Planctomycetota bacterium]